MDIKWYGHSCFRIKDRIGTVWTDPFPPKALGYNRPNAKADVVTISHAHPNHSSLEGFTNEPYVISRPGEYEVNGIFVTAIRTAATSEGGQPAYNNVMVIQFDDLSACHLGDLNHVPAQDEVEKLGEVDVLLVPVGGDGTLTAAQAVEVISLIEPYIVIPMHYGTAQHSGNLDTVEKFLKEMGATSPTTLDELKLSRSSLPEETQLFLLNHE